LYERVGAGIDVLHDHSPKWIAMFSSFAALLRTRCMGAVAISVAAIALGSAHAADAANGGPEKPVPR